MAAGNIGGRYVVYRQRPYNPMLPPGVKWLLISNFILFVIYFFAARLGYDRYFEPFWLSPRWVIQWFALWQFGSYLFLHDPNGFQHILFNMLWLRDLGSMIEARQSTWHLAILALVIAACSNVAQYFFTGNPVFGGMSGVVYGLLGYIWIRGKCDPGSGLFVHKSTVTMMIIWFFLCYSGLLGSIANTAHAVGLGMGMAWGYLSSVLRR